MTDLLGALHASLVEAAQERTARRPSWHVPSHGRTASLRASDGKVLATMRLTDDGTWDCHTPGGGPIALGCPSREAAQDRAREAGYGPVPKEPTP